MNRMMRKKRMKGGRKRRNRISRVEVARWPGGGGEVAGWRGGGGGGGTAGGGGGGLASVPTIGPTTATTHWLPPATFKINF